MSADSIFASIKEKESFLCIGLDPDISKFPESVLETDDPVYEFNKKIVDATHTYAVAYKPNIAFYEALGAGGWWSLEKTVEYIRKKDSGIFLIADAKRGDIGNTSGKYATAWFDNYGFDAVTVAPYMGEDSVKPFLEHTGKWTVLLAVTSNPGSVDFQMTREDGSGMTLFEKVVLKSSQWGTCDNMMFVAGATRPEMISKVRSMVPEHFLLVPGIGAQGGDLESVAANGINDRCGLLVNSSRAIIYSDDSDRFDLSAGEKASVLRDQMSALLRKHNII